MTVDNVSKAPEIIKKIETTMLNKYGVSTALILPENQLKASEKNGYRVSKINKKWQKLLKNEFDIDFEFEQLINDSSYADLGYENLLIDVNPSVSHNNSVGFAHLTNLCTVDNCFSRRHSPTERLYHQKRALEAEANDKILLQYFDWYDKNVFLNMVESKLKRTPERLYARKTELKEITQVEANRFLKANHLLGGTNGQSLCLGLFDKDTDELVHVQTYGKARMNKNVEWEAVRSCSRLNTQVIGGFSKCDKYFFEKINPNSVISYVDLSTSIGETEGMFNGWSFSHISSPSAMWVKLSITDLNKSAPIFIKDSSVRRASADRMLGFQVGENYPKFDENGSKITNDYVMLSEGYVKVYDCGTKVFVWRRP